MCMVAPVGASRCLQAWLPPHQACKGRPAAGQRNEQAQTRCAWTTKAKRGQYFFIFVPRWYNSAWRRTGLPGGQFETRLL
ncbi:hypothetical protein E2C01_001328 [Portunus trituberculatus]|uniref:Uncharacterized protein n=1 Tax=Portunus trituberculatus TaxID=210409 RepID=A0A5B7CJ42_PORTR|nr:hypothetical protein [Portunus trituberculatus]